MLQEETLKTLFWNIDVKYCVLRCDCLVVFKEIIQPKMKICLTFTQPQDIKDVGEFVSSSAQIWRNLASHHLTNNGSSAVNGCHQNESINQNNAFSRERGF